MVATAPKSGEDTSQVATEEEIQRGLEERHRIYRERKLKKLTLPQQVAALIYLHSGSQTMAARQIGVDRTTIWRWLNYNEAFKEHVQDLQRDWKFEARLLAHRRAMALRVRARDREQEAGS